MGKKRTICRECSKAKFPAISAAKLGHEACLVTAYRVLGVFNERDGYGATPIHYAARGGQLDCLKWLISNSGISPVAAAKNGTTAAHDAAAMGHLLCLQFLLENTKCSPLDRTNEGATVLHMACRFGHVAVTRWLIERGLSSPTEKGDNGVTPVHLCAAKNHLDCLKYLTHSSYYVPNQLTVHGATPIYFAAQEGSLECLQWLVEHGKGDPMIYANDGMGPLHAAAQAGELSCMKWLILFGGVPARQKAEDGATPMHFSAAGGKILCLKWLFENGGSLLDRDDLGGTPLHDAAEQGQIEAVSFILSCGIQKDIPDNDGLTPIDLAKDNNHEECMKLFYIKSPNLLNSITPQQPQNRASGTEDEIIRREKQRQFEKVLLSNTTQKEREDIWKGAKENFPEPRASNPDSSKRRLKNRNSIDEHRLSLSLINDLVDDHSSKERPALSPELFLQPNLQTEDKDIQNTVAEGINGRGEENIPEIPQNIGKSNHIGSSNEPVKATITKPDKNGGNLSNSPHTSNMGATNIDFNGGTKNDHRDDTPAVEKLAPITTSDNEEDSPYDSFFTKPVPSVSKTATAKTDKSKTSTKTSKPKKPIVTATRPSTSATHPSMSATRPSTSPLKEKQQQPRQKKDHSLQSDTPPAINSPSPEITITSSTIVNQVPSSSDNHSNKGSSGKKPSTSWKTRILQRLSFKKSSNSSQPPESQPATSGGDKHSKGAKKSKTDPKGAAMVTTSSESSGANKVAKNVKQKKGKLASPDPSTEGVVMRRKTGKSSTDKVFSHRTSKVEEYAIVSQRRTSTDDPEVAVKFESRPVATRQSTLSAISDNMSSPESSSDEHNHDGDDEFGEDIFRPISKTGFDRFGELIEEEHNQQQQQQELLLQEDSELEARGSLASLDTMVMHEETIQLLDTGSLKGIDEDNSNSENQKPLEEEQQQEQVEESSITRSPPLVWDSVGDVSQFSELRPSLSPSKRDRKQMILQVPSIVEEEEEGEEFEDENEDSLAPLPNIHATQLAKDTMAESWFNKRDNHELKTMPESDHLDEVPTDDEPSNDEYQQSNVTIEIQSVPGYPIINNENKGVRSFALVKQMYDSQRTSMEGLGGSSGITPPRGQRRNSPVFSPLMVVATASQRVSLTSVQEEDGTGVNEKEPRDNEECGKEEEKMTDEEGETNNDSTKELHISLTPSQEAAFDDLEKLKESLDSTETKEEKQKHEEEAKPNRKEAMRTSPVVDELLDMIKGLNDLIEQNKSETVTTTTSTPPAPIVSTSNTTTTADTTPAEVIVPVDPMMGVTISRDNISEDISLSGYSEIQSLASTPRQNVKKDELHQESSSKEAKKLSINVEIDGHETVHLSVKSTSLVISVIFKAAEAAGLDVTKHYALFEVHSSLRIERPLEDHERIEEIVSKWPKKNSPHFHLHTYHEKYLLWENNPFPKGSVVQFLKQGKTPNVASPLHYCKGVSAGKGKWLRGMHCLGSLGIYQINSSSKTPNSSMDLICGTDQLLYFPIATTGSGEWTRYKPLPSKHCFVLKPATLWREKDMRIFCCDDYHSFSLWISGIRLVKYGLQLKCNYIGMRKRLEQQQQSEVSASPPLTAVPPPIL